MNKEILLKPNQLIGLKTDEIITVTQRKVYNVFLKAAQYEVKFGDLKEEEIDKNKTYWFEIDYKVAHDIAGAENKNLKYIEQEMKKLIKILVEIKDKKKDDWKDVFSLLPRIKKEDGKYKFMLIGDIVKALKEQNYFTHLDLIRMQDLSSQYSVIFYELAIKYKKVEIPKLSVKEIREMTNTQNKYSIITDLKKRVLDPACEEISEKTDIILSYKTEKRGRRITHIKFNLEKKEDNFIETNKEEDNKELKSLFDLLPHKEQIESNKRELAKLLKLHSFEYLKGDIQYAIEVNPDNFIGFLKASCKNGHYCSRKIEEETQREELVRKKIKEERKREKINKKIEEKAKKKAKERYESLSKEDFERYLTGYDFYLQCNIGKMNTMSKESYVISALEDEIKEELRELAEGII